MSRISHAKLIGYSPQIGGHSERIKPLPQIDVNPALNQTLSQLANLNLSPNSSPNINANQKGFIKIKISFIYLKKFKTKK
jgi:hypothetical protein